MQRDPSTAQQHDLGKTLQVAASKFVWVLKSPKRKYTQQIGWINGCCHHPRDRLGDPNPRGTGQFPPDSPSWNHLRPPLWGATCKNGCSQVPKANWRSLIPPNDCQIVYYIYCLLGDYIYIYIISPTTKKSNHGNQSLTEDFLHEGMSMTSVPRDVSCDLIRSDFRCWGVEVCFFSATDMLTKSMKSDLSKYNLQSS